MPSSRISTSSRARSVTLRGGTSRTGSTSRTYSAKGSGYYMGAPRAYVRKPVRRYGVRANRRTNSFQPRITKQQIDIPKYIVANHNAFHSKAEGVKVPAGIRVVLPLTNGTPGA